MTRTPNTPGSPVASYVLDQEKALAWINSLIEQNEEGEDFDEDSVALTSNWEPRDYDEHSTIDQLVYRAQQQEGVLTGPVGDLFYNFEDDSEGGMYRFLVDVDFDLGGFRHTLRLASQPEENRRIGSAGTTGAEAALAILDEAVSKANCEISVLNAFMGTRS